MHNYFSSFRNRKRYIRCYKYQRYFPWNIIHITKYYY